MGHDQTDRDDTVAVAVVDSHAGAAPRQRRHARRLRDDGRPHLQEDEKFGVLENILAWQTLRYSRCMSRTAPPGPVSYKTPAIRVTAACQHAAVVRCYDLVVLELSPHAAEPTLSPRAAMAAAEGPRKRMPSAVAASAVGSSGFSDAWPLAGETRCPGQNWLDLFQFFQPALKLSRLEFLSPLRVPCGVQPQGPELKLLRNGHGASKSFLLGSLCGAAGAPAGPHGIDAGALGDLHDEAHVGVVVGVGPARHLHKLVRQPDVLRVLHHRSQSSNIASLDGPAAWHPVSVGLARHLYNLVHSLQIVARY